jgi:hypothetical protein
MESPATAIDAATTICQRVRMGSPESCSVVLYRERSKRGKLWHLEQIPCQRKRLITPRQKQAPLVRLRGAAFVIRFAETVYGVPPLEEPVEPDPLVPEPLVLELPVEPAPVPVDPPDVPLDPPAVPGLPVAPAPVEPLEVPVLLLGCCVLPAV